MKKLCSLLLCLAMAFAVMSAAGAEGMPVQKGWAAEESALVFYGKPAGQVTAECSGTALEAALSTAEEENVPITYFCLVDMPSAFESWGTNPQPAQEVEALKEISTRMRSCDKMVLATMGQKLTVSELSGDKNERLIAIEAIQTNWAANMSWNTNLYQNIVDVLGRLSDDTQYPGIRQLVILTDGNNRSQSSTTLANVSEAVDQSGVFVSWVAVLTANPDSATLNNLTVLQEACSGAPKCLMLAPNRDRTKPSQAGDDIVDLSLAASVIHVGTDSIPRSGETAALTLTLDGEICQVEVPVAELPEVKIVIPETTETEPPATVPLITEPGARETEEDQSASQITVFGVTLSRTSVALLCVAGGAVALIAIMMLLSRIRMNLEDKKMRSMDTDTVFGSSDESLNDADLQERLHVGNRGIFDDMPVSHTVPVADAESSAYDAPAAAGGCQVDFCDKRGRAACTLELEAGTSKTVGRSTRSDVVLNANDAGMSGVHFEMYWDGSALFLRDRGSTNGTEVNGVLQEPQQWVQLEDRARIGVGNYEYVIAITAV